MDATAEQKQKEVKILYTNWKGVREWRVIIPQGQMTFMKTVWHPEEQWCLLAFCTDRKEDRVFVMKDIEKWEPLVC